MALKESPIKKKKKEKNYEEFETKKTTDKKEKNG